jgi:hypothetical protein
MRTGKVGSATTSPGRLRPRLATVPVSGRTKKNRKPDDGLK